MDNVAATFAVAINDPPPTVSGNGWIVDAHRGDGRRFIVESDELLTAFLELESTLL